MSRHPAPRELTASIELPSQGPLQRAAKAAVFPWVALWGWVAVDSALTYCKSREAIDHAIEADPIEELYDGPQEQSGRIKRWLLWSPGSLDRLRDLRKRARTAMIGAPLIALAGSAVLLTLGGRRRGRA
ncbi:MAG TPA: hypothetical protein VGM25_06495 [Caulobacteraceae bacterium]|jgi:hypothetical protein